MTAVADLETVAEACRGKATTLLFFANQRTTVRKFLNIAAGVLALFSAASITAVIAELTSSFGVKVVAASVAFLSGIITLVVSSFFDEREIQKAHEGAAKFMSLRDQAHLATRRPDISEKQAFAELSNLVKLYNSISGEYD